MFHLYLFLFTCGQSQPNSGELAVSANVKEIKQISRKGTKLYKASKTQLHFKSVVNSAIFGSVAGVQISPPALCGSLWHASYCWLCKHTLRSLHIVSVKKSPRNIFNCQFYCLVPTKSFGLRTGTLIHLLSKKLLLCQGRFGYIIDKIQTRHV